MAATGASSAAPTLVCWLSVDPVRRKLDFYPKAIAAKVEKAYQDRDPWNPSACVLGSDFFNATVHFHPSGSCYQTTPGMSMGRAGFKQPGYRSVKRVVKPTEGPASVVVFSKQVHGEWRIAANEADSEVKFEDTMPSECMVEGAAQSGEGAPRPAAAAAGARVRDATAPEIRLPIAARRRPAPHHASARLCRDARRRRRPPVAATQHFRPWKGEDLSSGAWDVSVVVWQWCAAARRAPPHYATPVRRGDARRSTGREAAARRPRPPARVRACARGER